MKNGIDCPYLNWKKFDQNLRVGAKKSEKQIYGAWRGRWCTASMVGFVWFVLCSQGATPASSTSATPSTSVQNGTATRSTVPVFHDAASRRDYEDWQKIKQIHEQSEKYNNSKGFDEIAKKHAGDTDVQNKVNQAKKLQADIERDERLLEKIQESKRGADKLHDIAWDGGIDAAKKTGEAVLSIVGENKGEKLAGILAGKNGPTELVEGLIDGAETAHDLHEVYQATSFKDVMENFPGLDIPTKMVEAGIAAGVFGGQVSDFIDYRINTADLFMLGGDTGAIFARINAQRDALDRLKSDLDALDSQQPTSAPDPTLAKNAINDDEAMKKRYEEFGSAGLVKVPDDVVGVAEDEGSVAVVDLREDPKEVLDAVQKQANDMQQKMEKMKSKSQANLARVSAHFRPNGRPSASNDPKINMRARVTQGGGAMDTSERDAQLQALLGEAMAIVNRAQRLANAASHGVDVTSQANVLLRDTETLVGKVQKLEP